MLKTLTLSLSLAVALGFCGVSRAGHHGATASEQCAAPSPQYVAASPQGECAAPAEKKCCLGDKLKGMGCHMGNKLNSGYKGLCAKLKPKPKCYTYEWVLKKKRVHGHKSPCGTPACETCAYPSAQSASPQGYSSPQGYGTPQGYGSPQAGYSAPTYGASQVATTTGMIAPAPVLGGDEAPPAPEVGGATSVPVPPAPVAPAASGPQSSLLFSTPAGN